MNFYTDANGNQAKYNIDINHAASIQFGQISETHWKFRDQAHANKVATSGFDAIILNEEDKQFVRENIMGAINAQITNRKIMKQYIRSLKMICVHDYPLKFPNLFT
jgi:hypothetical protein